MGKIDIKNTYRIIPIHFIHSFIHLFIIYLNTVESSVSYIEKYKTTFMNMVYKRQN